MSWGRKEGTRKVQGTLPQGEDVMERYLRYTQFRQPPTTQQPPATQLSPRPAPAVYTGGYDFSPFQWEMPTFNRDQMRDMARRRASLIIDPQIEALQRAIEQARVSAEAQRGEVQAGYRIAQEDLERMGQQHQREGAERMQRRGLYDSGMAIDMAGRIDKGTREGAERLGTEKARALGAIAGDLALQERHTEEQRGGLAARRGEWEADLLAQMEQQAFQNHMAEQEMGLRIWQANLAAQQAAARQAAAQVAGPIAPSFSDILNQYRLATLEQLRQNQGMAWEDLPLYMRAAWYGHQPWDQQPRQMGQTTPRQRSSFHGWTPPGMNY